MIFVKLCYILSSSSSVLILTETTSQFEGLNFCCIRRSQSQSLLCEVKVSYILNWEGKSISKLKIIFLWGCLPHGICYRMNAYNIIHRQLTQESMLPPLPSCSIVSWIHEGIADYRTAGGTSTKRKYQSKEERKSKERAKKVRKYQHFRENCQSEMVWTCHHADIDWNNHKNKKNHHHHHVHSTHIYTLLHGIVTYTI